MLSLKDLRSAPVALDWHEAVAVGAALGAHLVEAQATACPSAADVGLLPSGDLRVFGPGLIDGPAAAGVATVLAELLAGSPCPAELRQLVHGYAGESRDDGGAGAVADLVSELAFFERPGRREVLAALARRAEPALERAHRAAALDALTERTRLASGAPSIAVPATTLPVVEERLVLDPPADPHGSEADGASGGGHLIVPAAIGLVAFMAVAYVAAAWRDRPAPPPARVEVVEDPADLDPAEPATVSPAPAEAPSGRAPDGRQRPSAPASRARVPSTPTAATPPADPVAPPVRDASRPAPARGVDVVVAERDGRVVPSSNAPTRPPSGRTDQPGHVFQSGDPLVTPAVLIRPRLPDNPPPGVPEEQIGTLEIIVSESGAVEHVRLISPANRYQERMLVAAAKAWQFQPATRHGRPVRYRTRIRVTL